MYLKQIKELIDLDYFLSEGQKICQLYYAFHLLLVNLLNQQALLYTYPN